MNKKDKDTMTTTPEVRETETVLNGVNVTRLGQTVEAIQSEYEGDVDLRGFLDLDPKVRIGCREIRVKFKVKGDLDEATVRGVDVRPTGR